MSHLFWGFKQKKYTRYNSFDMKPRKFYNPEFIKLTDTQFENAKNNNDLLELDDMNLLSPLVLKSNMTAGSFNTSKKFLNNDVSTATERLVDVAWGYHTTVKYNRHRGELVPVNLARRLLRTKRTLVLPAHINITIVTNSCDVVHS